MTWVDGLVLGVLVLALWLGLGLPVGVVIGRVIADADRLETSGRHAPRSGDECA